MPTLKLDILGLRDCFVLGGGGSEGFMGKRWAWD